MTRCRQRPSQRFEHDRTLDHVRYMQRANVVQASMPLNHMLLKATPAVIDAVTTAPVYEPLVFPHNMVFRCHYKFHC
jgi:hypothetical protein